MTELYKDAYQNKYREETAQVHAPLSLIEKTKTAVREEEKRLAAAAQGMSVPNAGNANYQKPMRVFSVRKWAYPLTAAAAILILVSVSLTMRGLKSANVTDASAPACVDETAESGAVYEAAAEDTACEAADMEAPAAGAVEMPETEAYAPASEEAEYDMIADTAEEEGASDGITTAQSAGGVETADAGQTNETLRENANAGMVEPAEKKQKEELAENAERESADKAPQKSAADAQKQDNINGENFTIEKVAKRPARFSGSDVEIRRYEGKTFRVLETAFAGNNTDKEWEAYVDTAQGEGYVICGEAKSVEDFLAVAWEKLKEETE